MWHFEEKLPQLLCHYPQSYISFIWQKVRPPGPLVPVLEGNLSRTLLFLAVAVILIMGLLRLVWLLPYLASSNTKKGLEESRVIHSPDNLLKMLLLIILFRLPKFHRCTTPRYGKTIPGQDPHSQCFSCLLPAHDMNVCGPCLTSGPAAQHCRAMRLYLWNMEPRSRCPLPSLTVEAGITRLVLQLGSVDHAFRRLTN